MLIILTRQYVKYVTICMLRLLDSCNIKNELAHTVRYIYQHRHIAIEHLDMTSALTEK